MWGKVPRPFFLRQARQTHTAYVQLFFDGILLDLTLFL